MSTSVAGISSGESEGEKEVIKPLSVSNLEQHTHASLLAQDLGRVYNSSPESYFTPPEYQQAIGETTSDSDGTIVPPTPSTAGLPSPQSIEAIIEELRATGQESLRPFELKAEENPFTTAIFSPSSLGILKSLTNPLSPTTVNKAVRFAEVCETHIHRDPALREREPTPYPQEELSSAPSSPSSTIPEVSHDPPDPRLLCSMHKLSLNNPFIARPLLRHYTVHKPQRHHVRDFLCDYCGAERDIPYALLLIDASGEGFDGAVIVVLRAVMNWNQPSLFQSCAFEGEAILIPANHDPWRYMERLVKEGMLDLVREYDDRLANTGEAWVQDLCYETYAHAKPHFRAPTMARLEGADELFFVGWSLHLAPILRNPQPVIEDHLIEMLASRNYRCRQSEIIEIWDDLRVARAQMRENELELANCRGLVDFTARLLVWEARALLEEEDPRGWVMPWPECRWLDPKVF
jgi:hypothetical protein